MKAIGLVAGTILLLLSVTAQAIGPTVRRVTPPNRPYIVEVGEPQPLGPQALQRERRLNNDLRVYTDIFGLPDYAELQEIEPDFPWDDYEVRLYYLDKDREIAFGRAFVSPDVTDLGVVKSQGRIDAATRDRIVALMTPSPMALEEPEPVEIRAVVEPAPEPPSDIELLVRRVEAAADRALAAADQAAVASESAARAADRTVNIIDKMVR